MYGFYKSKRARATATLMLALLGDAERHGAVLALHAPVTAITVGSAGLQVEVGGDGDACHEFLSEVKQSSTSLNRDHTL